MNIGIILLIVLTLVLIGVLPTWPHSRNWGYLPSGGLALVVVIVLVVVVASRQADRPASRIHETGSACVDEQISVRGCSTKQVRFAVMTTRSQ